MTEIKGRLGAVHGLHTDDSMRLGKIARLDACYLQLRLICECIALSCLVAHGDVPGAKSSKLRATAYADKIIAALSKLHPNFYPHPQHPLKKIADGQIELAGFHGNHLTRADLKKLYNDCGERLHRGPLQTLKPLSSTGVDFSPIPLWTEKIRNLLQTHTISLLHTKNLVLVTLGDHKQPADIYVLQKIADQLPSNGNSSHQ